MKKKLLNTPWKRGGRLNNCIKQSLLDFNLCALQLSTDQKERYSISKTQRQRNSVSLYIKESSH